MPSSEESQSAEGLLAEDHEALGKLLTALLAALDKGDAATAFARLDLFWARLAMHIRAEHVHLFPAILRALPGDPGERADETPATAEAREAIQTLRSDHDFFMHQLISAVKIMREFLATRGCNSETGPLDDVRQIISVVNNRLEAHNKLEEEMVYRLPAKLLAPEEQNALEGRLRDELENLPRRFRDGAGDD